MKATDFEKVESEILEGLEKAQGYISEYDDETVKADLELKVALVRSNVLLAKVLFNPQPKGNNK